MRNLFVASTVLLTATFGAASAEDADRSLEVLKNTPYSSDVSIDDQAAETLAQCTKLMDRYLNWYAIAFEELDSFRSVGRIATDGAAAIDLQFRTQNGSIEKIENLQSVLGDNSGDCNAQSLPILSVSLEELNRMFPGNPYL